MTRSTEFDAAVKHGIRAVQPDIVVHAQCRSEVVEDGPPGPRMGLIVAKSVGSAVQRHRVARRLRHVARSVLADLDRGERVVIRALPSSRQASSATLQTQLHAGLRRAHQAMGSTK